MKNIGKRGLPYKRKREGKTDYRKRLSLLKSGLTRMIIRKSLKEITIQFINYHPDGDKVLLTTRSGELKKQGLTGSMKNIPAAYLTGILAGKKAKELKISKVTPDFGIRKPHKKGAVFAALKGVIDSGITTALHDSNKDEAIFPDKERLKGNHTKAKINYEQIKDKISK
jgi:large subunit ribosomal protein L18